MDTIEFNNENHAISPPNRILGYTIRSRTKIYISYVIPSILAACVYIVQIISDCAVSYELFRNNQPKFGVATVCLVLIPPFLTFIMVLSSKEQWHSPKYSSRTKFFGFHMLQTLLFPFFTMYRFSVRIFWSIEALFQENNDAERMLCLERSQESATCELYLFIQAYAQAAPQIILQMYHMLTQDLFRDFQTTTAQAISLVFSAIDLAAITTSYQRFESQRQVGRAYPWSPPQQIRAQRQLLECDSRLRHECLGRKQDSERTLLKFPASEVIMKNFERNKNDTKIHDKLVHSIDEVDNEVGDVNETSVLIHATNDKATTVRNATDDDKIRDYPKLIIPCKPNTQIRDEQRPLTDVIQTLDTVPNTPPPPPLPPLPPVPAETPLLRSQKSQTDSVTFSRSNSHNKRSSRTFSQLETFKDMLIVNAQLYIKDHVPHPPKMLIQRIENSQKPSADEQFTRSSDSPIHLPADEIDFFIRRPTKIIKGVQQEDFAAKTIAFFGWIAFIVMRMLALSTFSCFYPKAFFILVGVHYTIMLIALCLETRFQGKASVFLFYPMLAYVFIFVLLEFRIKFKRIRLWFVGYFLIAFIENIIMTIVWNTREEYESWWFDFITECITYSGLSIVATLIVYYYILKPKDVILIVEDDAKVN